MFTDRDDVREKIAKSVDNDVPKYIKKLEELKTKNEMVSSFVNSFCNDYAKDNQLIDLLIHEVRSQHRTHQQIFIKNLCEFLKDYGNSYNDMRNKESVEWAKEASNLESAIFPFL